MTKNMKGAIAVTIVAAIAFIAWKTSSKKKKDDAQVIVDNGHASNIEVLRTFDPAFVKAWADASRSGQPQFFYNGFAYNTTGGKSVK
jgi:uncharacterized protein YbcV (DUF1398 family)